MLEHSPTVFHTFHWATPLLPSHCREDSTGLYDNQSPELSITIYRANFQLFMHDQLLSKGRNCDRCRDFVIGKDVH